MLVLIVAAGFIAYDSLVKESLLDLETPQAAVSTFGPGADPQTIDQEIGKFACSARSASPSSSC